MTSLLCGILKKLLNVTKKVDTYIENKLAVISREREVGRGRDKRDKLSQLGLS